MVGPVTKPKIVKKYTKSFKRFHSNRFLRVKESWRRPKASYFFESDHNQLNKRLKEEGYSDCNSVCDALAEAGFIPIRIAGVYTRGINFMNAIVN